MKRFLTVILLITMLLNCIMPAVEVLAASVTEMTVEAGIYEVLEGTTAASPVVSVKNNPGIAYLRLAITYKSAELALNKDADLVSPLLGYYDVSTIKNKYIPNYIPEGESAILYKGFYVDLEDENLENVYADGALVSLPLSLVDPAVGNDYEYYVTVVEAYDSNWDDVNVSYDLTSGYVSYIKDEYIGKYDEFSMFFAPETVNIKKGEEVDLDLRLDANPGLWSIRCMVVYPEALSLEDNASGIAAVENGTIFDDFDLSLGIANLPLTDSRLLEQYKRYFAENNIPTEGYNSVVLYYEPADYDTVISGNGVLASFTFNTENAVDGETYDIMVYSIPGDIFRAEGNQTFVDLHADTYGCKISISGCEHDDTHTETTKATCTVNGYTRVVCNTCGAVVNESTIKAPGHNYLQPGSTVIVPPTCTEGGYTQKTCQVCGYVAIMNKTEPDGHSFVNGICEYCGESDGTVVIDGIYTESIEVMEGTTKASPSIYIGNNPGVSYVRLAVIYKASELAKSDADATSDLFNEVYTGSQRAGGHREIAAYLPKGAVGADYKGFIIELDNYDEQDDCNENVVEDGIIVNLPLELVSPEVGDTYSYYVTVVEAWDENDDDIVLAEDMLEGTVSVIKDENLGKYDSFTMFFAPETVEVNPGEKATVDLRLDQNPGLWSIRCMVVYPEELSVDANSDGVAVVENGVIFADSELNPGIANLPLTDDRLIYQYKNYFAANGIPTEGYNSVVLYYEPEKYDAVISGNGVLASLTFNTDNCVAGESYDIQVYYVKGDIFRVEPNQVFIDLYPETYGCTVEVTGCEHPSTKVSRKDPTCGEDGYIKNICTECNRAVGAVEVLPATGMHAYGEEVVVKTPTCATEGLKTKTCTVCGDVKNIPVYKISHTPGAGATCNSALTCIKCGEELAPKLDHAAGDPVTVPATCTEDGSKTVSCTLCGDVISTVPIKAPGHNYLQPGSTVIVPPTCTEGGYTQKTCQVCGDVAVMSPTEPMGHTAGDPEITTEATCDQMGIMTVSCVDCGLVIGEEYVDMLPHSFVKGTCTVCGAVDEGYSVISVESIEKEINTGEPMNLKVYLEDNPGVTYINMVVYYKASELKLMRNGKLFDNSIFSVDDSTVSIERAGTNSSIVNYLPEGADPSLYRGVVIELCSSYDENGVYELITENGLMAELPFVFVNEPAVGDVYTYGITVVEATDQDWNEVDISAKNVEGTISFVSSPFDGQFADHTIFIDIESDDIDIDKGSFEVDLRVENNPGVWATRAFIVYPDTLSLKGAENGEVYTSDCFVYGIADLPVGHEQQLPQFKALIEKYDIPTEGYNALTVYFEPEDPDAKISYDGILATLEFVLTESVVEGDIIGINVYCAQGDIFSTDRDENGRVIFTDYLPQVYGDSAEVVSYVCRHRNTMLDSLAPTCTEDGYEKEICSDCGVVLKNVKAKATGHTEKTDRIDSTCLVKGSETVTCSVCEELISYTELDFAAHTPGNEIEKKATCQRDGMISVYCSVCNFLISTRKTEDKKPHNYVNGKCTMCGSVVRNESIKLSLVDGPVTSDNTVDVDVTLEGNPGIWSLRYFVIYPEELVLLDAENGVVFEDDHFVCGTKNLPLGDSAQVKAFQKYLSTNGIETQRKHSTLFYYEPDVVDYETGVDGILAKLNFAFTEEAQVDEVYGIEIVCLDGDMFSASYSNTGMPEFTEYYPTFYNTYIIYTEGECAHSWEEQYEAPTCQKKGTVTYICSLCGETGESYEYGDIIDHNYVNNECTMCKRRLSDENVMMSLIYTMTDNVHWENITLDVKIDRNPGLSGLKYYIVYPEEFTVVDCENGDVFDDKSYSNGEMNVALDSSLLDPDFKEFLRKNNISTSNKRSTAIYFDPDSADAIFGDDGILSKLYFELSENIVEGKFYDVDIYCIGGDMYSASYEEGSDEPVITEYAPDLIGIMYVLFDTTCYHEKTYELSKESTCTERGYKKTMCYSCGTCLRDETLPLEDHIPSDGPTCTDPQICLVCETVLKTREHKIDKTLPCNVGKYCLYEDCKALVVPAKAHTWPEGKLCTEDKYCTECNAHLEDGKDQHSIGENTDCTKDRPCQNKDCPYVKPGTAHEIDENLPCNVDKYCLVCGLLVEKAKDHTWPPDKYCTENKYCTECNELLKWATQHNYEELTDCTKDRSCLNCPYVKRGTDHIVDEDIPCDEDKYCLVCGLLVEKAKKHTWPKDKYCDEYKYCTVCDELLENPKDHTEPIGKLCTETKYCVECKKLLAAGYAEHSFEENTDCTKERPCQNKGCPYKEPGKSHVPSETTVVIKEATCEEEGLEAILCKNCNIELGRRAIPPKGHKYVNNKCKWCGLYNKDANIIIGFDKKTATVQAGKEFDAAIKLSGNPGIWSLRLFVVYPEELILEEVDNGSIFNDSYLTVGYKNLALSHEDQIKEFKSFMDRSGMIKDGFSSAILYYEPDYTDERITGNGILANLSFKVPENAAAGDEYVIRLYTLDGDMFYAYLDENGDIVYVDYYPTTEDMKVTVSACKHFNTSEEREDATCEKSGYVVTTCLDCGQVFEEVIDPLGHDFTMITNHVPATCMNGGYTDYSCIREGCGKYGYTAFGVPLGHDYSKLSEEVAPTCTEAGYKKYICIRCNEYGRTEIIDPIGHNFTEQRTEPDCTENGEIRNQCTRCPYSEFVSIIPALGHDYSKVSEDVAPTCTEAGYKTYVCVRCEEYGSTEWIDPLGHNCTLKRTIDPTCTEEGETRICCTRAFCDYYEVESTTPPLGHDYSKAVGYEEATCTEDGYRNYVCVRCDKYGRTETIPALGHNCTKKITIEPTCTKYGEIRLQCTRCSYYELESSIPPLGHDYSKLSEYVAPTCTEYGYNTYVCVRCEKYGRTEMIDPLGHNFITKRIEPTCTEAGEIWNYCTRCNCFELVSTIPPTGHKYTIEKVIEATCTKDGEVRLYCENGSCKDYIVDSVIPALGHRDLLIDSKKATETENGYIRTRCGVCKELLSYKIIPATGTGTVEKPFIPDPSIEDEVSFDVPGGKNLAMEIYGGGRRTVITVEGADFYVLGPDGQSKYYPNADGEIEITLLRYEYAAPLMITICRESVGEDIEVTLRYEDVGILGDIDGDTSINGKDMNTVAKTIGGAAALGPDAMLCADLNDDGVVNGKDTNILAKYLAGAIGSLW